VADSVGSVRVPQASGEVILTTPSTGDETTLSVSRHIVKPETEEQRDALLRNVPDAEPASSKDSDTATAAS